MNGLTSGLNPNPSYKNANVATQSRVRKISLLSGAMPNKVHSNWLPGPCSRPTVSITSGEYLSFERGIFDTQSR